jgi:acyl transferase domain-containing protein
MSKQPPSNQFPPHAIAIVGMAGRFPGARGLDEFWRNIREGVEILETFDDADLDGAGVSEKLRSEPNYVRKGTVLSECDQFDAGFFGYSPREAQIIDPQQRIFLECAWEALEHSGYAGDAIAHKAVGIFGGSSTNTYVNAHILRNPIISEAMGSYQLMIANDRDYLCSRVSYKLNLRGPSMTVQTACSTSLVAVALACRALVLGECDLALAGGVSLYFPRRSGYLYQEGMIFSPDGHCRPFDANGHGTRSGEGAGIVVLKRLSDALADRDTIHSVILGSAFNNDGSAKLGFTAPSIDGQTEVIVSAQEKAGVEPRTVTYLEASGIGLPFGDAIEIAALTEAFRASTADEGFCQLGSLKASLGHLDAASGVAALIKTTMALQHREIPPLVNFRTPNPELKLDRSPFRASAEGAPWTTDGTPRRAGVSSFGLGGTNAHVVLEEAPQTTPSTPSRGAHLLVLSAKTATALEQASANLADYLDERKHLSVADVEWTLQAGRQTYAHRRAIVVRNTAEAVERLRQPKTAPVLTGVHEGEPRPVVFLFGGQGSQHAGRGVYLYETESVYREAIDRCAAILEPHLGSDIRNFIFPGQDDAAINEARFAQPALFATGYALASLWMSWGIIPCAMLGHDVGEYVAAHLAGVLSLEDANAVVAARGQLMHRPDDLGSALKGPVIASFTAVLERVALSPPNIPYVSSLTGKLITPEQATSPIYYGSHIHQTIPFEAGIRTLAADPAAVFLEIGPGNALTPTVRLAVGQERAGHAISSLSHSRHDMSDGEAILQAAGQLWLAGARLDWTGLKGGSLARRIPLPTYPFERKRHWVDGAVAGQSEKLAPAQNSSTVALAKVAKMDGDREEFEF